MRLSFQSERVLAVTAHPDDAELLCAGTLARARADGAAIAICIMCRGDKGQPATKVRKLAGVRRSESKRAAGLLGAAVFHAGFADGALRDGAAERRRLIEILRQFRPTLVLAHSPDDYHSDHRAASAVAEAASWSCASRGQHTGSAPLEKPPVLWWMDTIQMNGFTPGFYVDVSEFLPLKEQMLACHATQTANSSLSLADLMRTQAQMRGAQAGVLAAEAFQIHRAFRRMAAW